MSALHFVENQVTESRNKHIDIKSTVIKHVNYNVNIELVKIDDKLNLVDELIKIIHLKNFNKDFVTIQVLHEEHKLI